ncbi:19263_t:CDS:2 [Funneliformis geosporum]|nr:19263_t:CDS:2 [Funneliformis geosporum]
MIQVAPEGRLKLNIPKIYNAPLVSERIDLRHIRSLSSEMKKVLKSRRVRIDKDLDYSKHIKDVNPQNWDVVRFYDGNSALSFADEDSKKINDHASFSSEAFLHFLQERYGEKETKFNYKSGNEYFVEEFFNDSNLATAISASDTVNTNASLSAGSGQMIYLGDLTKSERKSLEKRRVIIWDGVTNHEKILKYVVTKNLGDIKAPIDSFNDLVAKVKKANKLLKMAKNGVYGQFANQELLDIITPVGGAGTKLGDLAIYHLLQGGEAVRVDYDKGQELFVREFMHDDITQVIRAFLIDENRVVRLGNSGLGTGSDTGTETSEFQQVVAKLNQIQSKLDNQIKQSQENLSKAEKEVEKLERELKSEKEKLAKSEEDSLLTQRGLITINKHLSEEVEKLKQQIERLRTQSQVVVPPKGNI